VDVKDRSFAARSLECYVCHGAVSLEHSKNTALVHLSRKRKDHARVITSICAQCHVRTGKSKSTGLPYPNNFVAGDNLFRDFEVDFSEEQTKLQNPVDAHVLENARDVVVLGKNEVTCVACHDVHKQSTKKHHLVRQGDLCLHCHNGSGSKKLRKTYEVHSKTCEY
jgi:predicted CXXCH cytochrome family protein